MSKKSAETFVHDCNMVQEVPNSTHYNFRVNGRRLIVLNLSLVHQYFSDGLTRLHKNDPTKR